METIIKNKENIHTEDVVQKALDKSKQGVVVLPQYYPWKAMLCQSHALSVVFPNNHGGYNVQAVPESMDSSKVKSALPEKWLTEKPEGCSFVHPTRSFATFDTEEHAVAAATTATRQFIYYLAGLIPEYEYYDMQDVESLHSAADSLLSAIHTGKHPELSEKEECALATLVYVAKFWGHDPEEIIEKPEQEKGAEKSPARGSGSEPEL